MSGRCSRGLDLETGAPLSSWAEWEDSRGQHRQKSRWRAWCYPLEVKPNGQEGQQAILCVRGDKIDKIGKGVAPVYFDQKD